MAVLSTSRDPYLDVLSPQARTTLATIDAIKSALEDNRKRIPETVYVSYSVLADRLSTGWDDIKAKYQEKTGLWGASYRLWTHAADIEALRLEAIKIEDDLVRESQAVKELETQEDIPISLHEHTLSALKKIFQSSALSISDSLKTLLSQYAEEMSNVNSFTAIINYEMNLVALRTLYTSAGFPDSDGGKPRDKDGGETTPASQLRTALALDKAAFTIAFKNSIMDRASRIRVEACHGFEADVFIQLLDKSLIELEGLLSKGESVETYNAHYIQALHVIIRLCINSGRFPNAFYLPGDKVIQTSAKPEKTGGFSTIYKGTFNGDSVCLKRPTHYSTDPLEQLRNHVIQEALHWRYLRHPNILRLIGVAHTENVHDPTKCVPDLISRWMSNGSASDYLNPERTNAAAFKLLLGTAQGLNHLHLHGRVHGDIRGDNIVVDAIGNACLIDFGLAIFENLSTRGGPECHADGGSAPWMSPELLRERQRLRRTIPTFASDVYAFACLCVELYRRSRPFPPTWKFRDVMAVVCTDHVKPENRPKKPEGDQAMPADLWNLVENCWKADPKLRPNMEVVVFIMTRIMENNGDLLAECKSKS